MSDSMPADGKRDRTRPDKRFPSVKRTALDGSRIQVRIYSCTVYNFNGRVIISASPISHKQKAITMIIIIELYNLHLTTGK
jgi:hypothetical protein